MTILKAMMRQYLCIFVLSVLLQSSLIAAMVSTDTHWYITASRLLIVDRQTFEEKVLDIGPCNGPMVIYDSLGYVVGRNELYIIDLKSNTLRHSQKFMRAVSSMTVHEKYGYIVHSEVGSICIFDLSKGLMTGDFQRTDPDSGPMVIHKNKGFCLSKKMKSMTVIDLSDQCILKRLSADRWKDPKCLTFYGDKAFFLGGDKAITQVDLKTFSTSCTQLTYEPAEMVVHNYNGYIRGDSINGVDVYSVMPNNIFFQRSCTVIKRIEMDAPAHWIKVRGDFLYVLSNTLDTVYVIDTTKDEIVQRLKTNHKVLDIAFKDDSECVLYGESKCFTIFDLNTGQVLRRGHIQGVSENSSVRKMAYIDSYLIVLTRNNLYLYDLENNKIVSTLSVIKWEDDFTIIDKRVYFENRGIFDLTEVSPKHIDFLAALFVSPDVDQVIQGLYEGDQNVDHLCRDHVREGQYKKATIALCKGLKSNNPYARAFMYGCLKYSLFGAASLDRFITKPSRLSIAETYKMGADLKMILDYDHGPGWTIVTTKKKKKED